MLHIKLSNIQTRNENKPWITPGLANSIRNKHKLYKSFCKEKDPRTGEYYEKQFKSCHNISSLLRKAKDSYYKQYFEDNKKNLRLVWQTIKGIINMKKKSDKSISIERNFKAIFKTFKRYNKSVIQPRHISKST